MDRPRVIVADASVFMRTMLKSQLEQLNFEVVTTAKNSQEATTKCQDTQPDMVLADIDIAEADDFALIRTARACPVPCCIVVMIPEETNLPEVVVEAVRAGASGYLSKPVSPQELKLRINGALRR